MSRGKRTPITRSCLERSKEINKLRIIATLVSNSVLSVGFLCGHRNGLVVLLIVPIAYEEGQTDYAIPIPADRLTKRGSRVNGLSKSSRFVASSFLEAR